jgi:hypothetical protein
LPIIIRGTLTHSPTMEAIRMMGRIACQPSQAPSAASSFRSPPPMPWRFIRSAKPLAISHSGT